jgi:hypothetical protein
LSRFELFSPTRDDHTSANFCVGQLGEAGSGKAIVLGYLRNVDYSESSEEAFSSIYLRPELREPGRISRLGVSSRRSAAKTAAPYHSGQSRPVEASPEVCIHRRCF